MCGTDGDRRHCIPYRRRSAKTSHGRSASRQLMPWSLPSAPPCLRDMKIPGREPAIHFAMEFLPTRPAASTALSQVNDITAEGKHVVIDHRRHRIRPPGTSIRQGARSSPKRRSCRRKPRTLRPTVPWLTRRVALAPGDLTSGAGRAFRNPARRSTCTAAGFW